MTRDAGKGAQALIDTMAEHWVIWAPDQASHLGRLFAAFRRVQRLQRGSRLTLLTARPLLPGAPTPAAVMDYWPTGMLRGDMAKHLHQVTLIKEPVRVLTEGSRSPVIQDQMLALLTYGAPRPEGSVPTSECVN